MRFLALFVLFSAMSQVQSAKATIQFVDCANDTGRKSVCFVRLVVTPTNDPNQARCKVRLPDIYIKNVSTDEPTILIFRITGGNSYSFDGRSVTISTGKDNNTTEDKNFDRTAAASLGDRFYLLINTVRYVDRFDYDVKIKNAGENGNCATEDPVIHNQN